MEWLVCNTTFRGMLSLLSARQSSDYVATFMFIMSSHVTRSLCINREEIIPYPCTPSEDVLSLTLNIWSKRNRFEPL